LYNRFFDEVFTNTNPQQCITTHSRWVAVDERERDRRSSSNLARVKCSKDFERFRFSRTDYSLFLPSFTRAQITSAQRELRSRRALDSVGSDRKRIGRKFATENETRLVPVFIVQLPLSLSPFFSTHLNSEHHSLYTPFSLMLQFPFS